MSKQLHPAKSCIMVNSAVLDHLKKMTATALKVYLYLCSRNQGQPISASTAAIEAATGVETRFIASALKVLREKKLITRIQGIGSHSNKYIVPLPAPLLTPVGSAIKKNSEPITQPGEEKKSNPPTPLSSQQPAQVAPAPSASKAPSQMRPWRRRLVKRRLRSVRVNKNETHGVKV